MSLFRRGNVWYGNYTTPSGKRIKESLGTTDIKHAQEFHDCRKAELWRIDKLGDFPEVTRWHQKAAAMSKKGIDIDDHTPQPVSTSTKAKHLALMKSIMRAAEREWKWIEKSPVINVPQERNKRVRWLEPAEAQRLIEECPDPLKSIVEFALSTIVNLKWQQIDMQRKVAWVHPEDSKSGRAIGVALNDMACAVLRRQIGHHHNLVFVHTTTVKKNDGTTIASVRKMCVDSNTAWRAAQRRAGIENFRFHDLRHTWASLLVQSGVPLSALQEIGGWESIEMVQRYAHLAPNYLTVHAQQIDAIFSDRVLNPSHCDKLTIEKLT